MVHRTLDTAILIAAAAALLLSFLVEFFLVGPVLFFLVFLLPPVALAAALAVAPRPWLHVASASATALVAAMFFFSSAAWLRHPMTFGGAAGQLGILLAGLALAMALVGGIGWALARRGQAPQGWREGWPRPRNLLVLAPVVFVLGMVTTGELVVGNPLEGSGFAVVPEDTVAVALREQEDDAFFEPAQLPIAAGHLVELQVTNELDVLSTLAFSADSGPYEHSLVPGSTTRILVRFAAAGEVPFFARSADPNTGEVAGRFLVS